VLGERGDIKAARLGTDGAPRGLARALYFPDRRVQFAAVKAMLRMPSTPAPVASGRVVEVLRRFLLAEPTPKALVAFIPANKAAEVKEAVKEIGFDPVLARDLKEIKEKAQQSADFDVIFLAGALPQAEVPYMMTQLRADADLGGLPVLVFAPKQKQESLARSLERYRNVKVYSDLYLAMKEELKNATDNHIREAAGAPLTPAERKEFTRVAMDVFWRMGRGDIQGYDLRPAQDAIARSLKNPDMVVQALEILGRLPGQDAQVRLAGLVLDKEQGKLRTAAAIELNRHIQKYGLLLAKPQVKNLKEALKTEEEDPALRAQLALVMGNLRLTPQATGVQLFEFRPDPPAPPPEKKEKEKEKEKDKDAR
jgi:hypothetical protein